MYYFEGMLMEVDGVIVRAQILHHKTISLARLQRGRFSVGIGIAIDAPYLRVAVAFELRVEGERDFNDFDEAADYDGGLQR